MNLSDVTDLTKDDLLATVGLSVKRSATERVLAAAGWIATGLVVGVGAALLLAPKSGKGLREDLSQQVLRWKSLVPA